MITLPDAIRKGAQLQPQTFGNYMAIVSYEHDGDRIFGTCAIGAAIAGIKGELLTYDTPFPSLDEFFEEETGCNLSTMTVASEDSPLEDPFARSLFGTITQLNDQAGWSREAIADWVESWLLKQNSYERWEQQ